VVGPGAFAQRGAWPLAAAERALRDRVKERQNGRA